MSVFTTRPAVYKVGVILLFLASAAFVVGFGGPSWIVHEVSWIVHEGRPRTSVEYTDYTYIGLWMWCSHYVSDGPRDDETECYNFFDSRSPYFFDEEAVWFKAVEALQCLCLAGLGVAVMYAIIVNCCMSQLCSRSRFLEILVALSGVIGFTGVMVFVGEMEPTFHQHPDGHKNPWNFSWAMYFALVSSLLAIIASIAIACNNPPQTRQTPTGPSEFDGVASFGASAVNSFPMNVQGGGVFPTRNQSNDYPFRENQGGSSIPTGTQGLLGGNPFPSQGCGSFPGGVQSGGFHTAPVYAVPGQGGNSSNQGPSPSSSVFMGSNILQGAPTQALSGQGGDMQAAPGYVSTNLSGMYTALSASALYASESSTTVPAERNISGPGDGYAVPSAPPYYL